jgi:hypothetical protein
VTAGAAQLAIRPGGPATIKEARRKGRTIVREAALIKSITDIADRKCRGRVKLRPDMTRRVGPDNEYLRNPDGSVQTRPCKQTAIKGGFVCMRHGGAAPGVRDKANKRLLAMVEPSLVELNELVHQNEHLPTKLGAIRTVLERAGGNNSLGPLKTEAGGDTKPIIQIGIKVGGIDKPTVMVGMLPPASVADGDVIEDDANDE